MSTIPLSFTKLIVADVDKMAAYYTEVFGFEPIERVESDIGGDPIDEIILGVAGEYAGGVILLKFTQKPAPTGGEVILGFTTDDIDALFAKILAAGGSIHAPVRDDPDVPYKVGFATDPEGHLAEIVELAGQP